MEDPCSSDCSTKNVSKQSSKRSPAKKIYYITEEELGLLKGVNPELVDQISKKQEIYDPRAILQDLLAKHPELSLPEENVSFNAENVEPLPELAGEKNMETSLDRMPSVDRYDDHSPYSPDHRIGYSPPRNSRSDCSGRKYKTPDATSFTQELESRLDDLPPCHLQLSMEEHTALLQVLSNDAILEKHSVLSTLRRQLSSGNAAGMNGDFGGISGCGIDVGIGGDDNQRRMRRKIQQNNLFFGKHMDSPVGMTPENGTSFGGYGFSANGMHGITSTQNGTEAPHASPSNLTNPSAGMTPIFRDNFTHQIAHFPASPSASSTANYFAKTHSGETSRRSDFKQPIAHTVSFDSTLEPRGRVESDGPVEPIVGGEGRVRRTAANGESGFREDEGAVRRRTSDEDVGDRGNDEGGRNGDETACAGGQRGRRLSDSLRRNNSEGQARNPYYSHSSPANSPNSGGFLKILNSNLMQFNGFGVSPLNSNTQPPYQSNLILNSPTLRGLTPFSKNRGATGPPLNSPQVSPGGVSPPLGTPSVARARSKGEIGSSPALHNLGNISGVPALVRPQLEMPSEKIQFEAKSKLKMNRFHLPDPKLMSVLSHLSYGMQTHGDIAPCNTEVVMSPADPEVHPFGVTRPLMSHIGVIRPSEQIIPEAE